MEKLGKKTRNINIYSHKNNQMICLHSKFARDYAMYLEEQSWVENYETEVSLSQESYANIMRTGIRGTYFQIQWTSDFLINSADGRKIVYELIEESDLQRKSEIEKLEFSRRYWSLFDVEWKVLLITNPEKT